MLQISSLAALVVNLYIAINHFSSIYATGDQTCTDPTSSDKNEGSCSATPFCGIYLAESTIPGAGLGIFTSVARNPGDVIGDGDICIPLIDMYWHNGEQPFFNPLYDYFWAGRTMGMARETDTDDIEALCPGLDCAINCNLALNNIEQSKARYDDSSLHRSTDPGVGAYSPYGNGTMYVGRYIPPGGELFKDYGDHWFVVREKIFGLLPLSEDFPKVSKLLKKMVDSIEIAHDDSKLDALQEFYEDIIVNTINKGSWETRTLNALPNNFADAKEAGMAEDISIIAQRGAIRDPEWLAKNGKCMDHIRSSRSTIKQAGKGAFAKRNLPAGTVITASPLHHFPDYAFMNMYNFTQQRDADGKIRKHRWFRLVDEVRHLQIYYNYCFGHPNMTMVLCPYGSLVNYINHNQTLANVRIRWAQDFHIGHAQRMVTEGTIEDLAQSIKPQLAFDYVAIRDLVEGEELFLDYGDVWEEAWHNHVKTYQPYHDAKYDIDPMRYSSAHQWNDIFGNLPLRTEEEQVYDPYPKNLQMRCHRALLQKQAKMGSEYFWSIHDYGLPCRVLDRFTETWLHGQEEILYTIQIENSHDDEEYEVEEGEEFPSISTSSKTVLWIEQTDVPREAVRFFDMPYTTDMHLVNAFRHAIQIPNDMIPAQWKNL